MPDERAHSTSPDWDCLYETASAQEGYFTTEQAAEAGYSPQLLSHYLKRQRIDRVRRGIYRIVHFPLGDAEDLVVIWLWSGREGVFSHETALVLHGLSDVMPARVHLTLPAAWKSRRLRVPPGTVLHHANIEAGDRAHVGCLPVTAPSRAVNDSAESSVSPDLVRQAIGEGTDRGLFTEQMIAPALRYVEQFASRSERR